MLCAYLVPEDAVGPPKNCPDCHCSRFREVTELQPADHPSPESVAHLKKKMENCPNYDVGEGGGKSYHKLVLVRTIDYSKAKVSSDPKSCDLTIQERCSECHFLYTQQVVPLSRPDVLERMGVLKEVEEHVGKLEAQPPP